MCEQAHPLWVVLISKARRVGISGFGWNVNWPLIPGYIRYVGKKGYIAGDV